MQQLFHIQIGAEWHGQRRVPRKHPNKPDGSRDISLGIGERDTNKNANNCLYLFWTRERYIGRKSGATWQQCRQKFLGNWSLAESFFG